MAAYGFAIGTGAFLLFLVQPLIGKFVLPWFGGAPGVWTTCLLFFQILLLGGYAYAHLSSRLLKPRAQVLLHLALVALALITLPITPDDSWKPKPTSDPALRLILLLAVSLGLPYFVLSATAPLLQHWFSHSHPGISPFRLYALSNAGSLLALLSYPAFFETWFTRASQATLWGIGLGFYAIACAWCGRHVWKSWAGSGGVVEDENEHEDEQAPALGQKLLWLLFPACASALLLATTNKICQDVAAIAFLWILPLAVYLLSFIICFDRPKWYGRAWFGPALLVALGAMGWAIAGRTGLSVPTQILIYALGLFVCCMVCHGEAYRLKPDPAHLTSFYLLIAAGGALGGFMVAVVAPAVFQDYFELHWGLVVCGALFLTALARDRRSMTAPTWPKLTWGAGSLALAGLAVVLWTDANRKAGVRTYRSRNFYGVLSVYRYANNDPALGLAELMHGRIVHGMQFLHPSRSSWPTLYFNPKSGIGQTFETLPPGTRRIGVVGLGAGTLAAYGQRGDQMRFYEINPEVEKVAREHFSFLSNSPAAVEVVLGDARLSLEQEPPQNFDLLVLDAFNSDSIPIHLLTKEAFEVYQRHLKTNGLIAVHVSNASLDLAPVVVNLGHCLRPPGLGHGPGGDGSHPGCHPIHLGFAFAGATTCARSGVPPELTVHAAPFTSPSLDRRFRQPFFRVTVAGSRRAK